MHKSAGGKSPPTTREKSSLPPENSTWHRDPRTDKTDRDKVGAGKRHWNGDQLSNMTPFQGVTSGASLNGNGFVPRSKPRFQGHYSGFFKETGNGPSFSATGPMDNGLVRRFHRNPYHSGASLAARSQGFSGSVGVDYRASDTEERQNRDQFLSSRDDKGRDSPLPPHTPQVHFDSSLLRNGERTKPLGSRNWEYSPKIDKDNITRPYAGADLYSSRRRSIVTQFDSDRGVGDKRSEVGRFERYGNGNRDGRADYESSNKDTGFSHGWRRERGNSGVIARHSSFTAASRNLGEIRARGSLSLGSAHDSLNATTLASNQDFDQPSPSKRPRLGWGQGLAKYEKKVDDVFPSVEKTCMKMDGEGDTRWTVEEVDKKRVEHEKHIVLGWEHENKRQHVDSFIDAHERRGENEMKTILISEHGVREVCGQYASSCALLGESLRRKEDERKPTLAQELQELRGRLASPVEMEDCEKYLRAGRDENSGAVFNDNEELDLRGQNPAPPILSGECESRRKDGEVACGLFQELELLKGKNQNYTPSALVEEPKTRQGEIAKNFFPVENFQDILERGCQNASLLEPLNNAKHDLSIFNTLIKAKTKGDLSSSSTSVADCETGGRKTESTLSFSPMPHSEMNGEDRDVVSPIDASPEMSSTGCEKHSSPRSHVVDDFLTAPSILAESFVLPPPSSSHLLISEPSSTLPCDVQDVTDISIDERPLEAEVLEEPGKNTSSEIEITPKETLVESDYGPDQEESHVFVREKKLNFDEPELASVVLRTEPTIAQDPARSDPSTSQVRGQVFVIVKFDKNLLGSEPASEGSLATENSTVYTYVPEDLNDVDCRVQLDFASQAEKSILETVKRVEAEIDSVKKKIAQLSFELSGDVSLEIIVSDHAGVSALDSPSEVAEYEDVSIPMDENTMESLPCSVDTEVLCHSSCQSSPTAVSTRLENSPICSDRDIFSTPALLLREFSMISVPEMGVLESVPGKVQLKSARFEKGVKGARNGSILLSLGSEDSDYPEILFGREVAEGGSLLHKRNQAIIESLVLENKEKARSSGVPFIHLLPQNLAGSLNQQLYHSPIEAPIWHHNAETHKSICDRLLMKIAERRHFSKFKEHVLTLRYRALKEAWKREQKGLFDRRNRPKTVGRWDGDGRSGYGPPSQRLSSRSRLLSMDRLDGESDASQAMKTLLKNLQVEPLRSVLKMPAMILDEKERAVRRFVSRNALVEDPIAVEMERKTLNPWTVDERKIFGEMFAVYNKNFKEIASYLQYKTTADCVEFYYRNKKSEDFGKSQHGIQLKNRWDYSKTSSTFLTPTVAGIKRNHGAICARIEALNVANMNTIPSESNIQLQVLEHANPLSEPFTMPSNVEMLEMILPFGATMETATSNWISTPCSVSSTAAPAADQYREKDSVKERIRSGPSTTRSSYSEQHPAGLKGTRTTHLRRMSSRAAAQEDSQWTDAERELFTSAVATFGKNFQLIASHIGTKNQSQCKAFFSKTRKRFCLDELVEQFQANEAASMLVQSFRHDADLAQEVKLINVPEMDAFAGVIAEELNDTAAAVSTLESLKGQSKCLANEMSDLSLVADAAAVMEEITLVKPEAPVLGFFSSGKSLTSSQDLACELLNVNRSSFTVPSILLREEDEEDEDSEATKSDSSYQVGTETENDIVVDQAAAALIGMSEMLADKSGLKRSKSEAKADTRSFPVSVSSRLQSARLSTSCPPSPAVTEANVCVTSGRPSRHAKERTNASITCKAITRDRPQDIHDAHAGRKSREMAGAEPKPRREPTSWTREEKERFAVILQEHGKDWALLHESLPSKSLTQIKTYFQNSKARSRLPTLDKLLNVVRNDGANSKRKADELESTRRDAELALLVNHKVRGHVASPELDSVTHKEDTLLGPALVSGTAGVGVDILAYAARFGTFSGQTADQDSLSMNGMQHVVRQMVSANTYAQRNTQDGYKIFRPARHALPSSVCLPTPGGIQQLFSASGPSKPVGLDLQALSPDVVPQAGPPAAIQQVAQQVQQMLQQQQHLQKQLNLLIQQQSALPPQLLPQHQQATHQTLQAVRPLEEKLHQVVQHLQQQYELQGRGQAPSQEEGLSRMDHFQHQQITPARGILKVKPIRGAVSTPLVDLVALPSSGVFPNKTKSHNEGIELQQQDHSLSLGIGTIATATAGSTAGVQETYAKTVELQDSDTDTDCEGMGSRLMVTEDSHQRMSIVRSTSSEQQQNTTQSTTSTLSSDSEQAKSCDVKLFGQSLLSKPQSLPSTASRLTRSSTQDFLSPNTSAPMAIMAFPTGTLSKALRTSESLPSAFGKVAALSINAGLQQPTSWLGKYGGWSARSSLEISGVGEISKKIIDSENALEAVTSLAAQSDAKLLVLASQQAPQMDDEHLDGESGNLSTVQLVTDAVIEGSPFIDKSQSSLIEGQVANSEADQCPIGALGLTQAPSQMSTIPSVLAGHGLGVSGGCFMT